jgi:hypothetical protein
LLPVPLAAHWPCSSAVLAAQTEKLLHSFGNGNDAAHPYAGLIDVKGTLYGINVLYHTLNLAPAMHLW